MALGMVDLELPESGIDPEALARHLWLRLERDVQRHLDGDGLERCVTLPAGGIPTSSRPRCLRERAEALTDAPLVSVVLATRDRPDALRSALTALQEVAYPRSEIVVVDNAPATSTTADVVAAFPGVRYVPEPRPGLSYARNRGVLEAHGEIVAFTDDDILVDPQWLAALATDLVRAVWRVLERLRATGL
jgi:hypothetical protein